MDQVIVYFADGDVSHEHGMLEHAVALAAAHGVGTTLKAWRGPAGGNPNVEFWSTDRRALVHFLDIFHIHGGFTTVELEAMVGQRSVA